MRVVITRRRVVIIIRLYTQALTQSRPSMKNGTSGTHRGQRTVEKVGFADEPAPKKLKIILLPGKMMTTVFCDRQSLIYMDYLKKDKAVAGLLLIVGPKTYTRIVFDIESSTLSL